MSTTALLVALAPAADREGPAALLRADGSTLIARLARQLRSVGVSEFVVITRPEWGTSCKDELAASGIEADARGATDLGDAYAVIADVAGSGAGSLVIAQAEVLTHRGAIHGLLADPRAETGMLVGSLMLPDGETPRQGWGVRVERGRIVSAGSPYHQIRRPQLRGLGVVRIGPSTRPQLVQVARRLAGILADGPPAEWNDELARKVGAWGEAFFLEEGARASMISHLEQRESASWLPDPGVMREELRRDFEVVVLGRAEAARTDAVGLLVAGLVRGGVTLRCSYLRELSWAQPFHQAAADHAARQMARVNEEKVLMDSAVKANDGFFGTFFCSPYTRYIARGAAKLGIVPNQVTVFSFLLGLSSALAFAQGTRAWLIAGAVLLYFTLAFDCVDGQLARYSKRFTALGAWLDPMFDRAKEYAVYAALAYGAVRRGADPATLWTLAGATLTMQTVKHFLDFSYAARQHKIIEALPKGDILEVSDPRVRTAVGHAEAALDDDDELFDEPARIADESSETQDAAVLPGRVGGTSFKDRLRALGVVGIRASRRVERFAWTKWIKRIIGFPIGERYAAISITAAVAGPKSVFVVMLAWNLFSFTYTATGRFFRSIL